MDAIYAIRWRSFHTNNIFQPIENAVYIYMTLYRIPVDILPSSARRALGSVIAKFTTFKDVGFDTFNKKNHSMVVPITDSCLSV